MKSKPDQHDPAVAGTPQIKWRSDYREEDFEYWPRPSELELAQLAARLARSEKIDPKQLVAEAWALYWESCRVIKADYQQINEYFEAEAKGPDANDDHKEEGGEPVPMPEHFPVTFRQVEMLLLPKLKGRTGERASVFREYAFAQIIAGSFTFRGGFRLLSYWDFQPEVLAELRKKFGEKVAERFGSWRKRVYDATAYAKFASPFLRWHSRWTERRSSEARAANARKGWDKRREENEVKTGARPQTKALREILEGPLPKKTPPKA